MKNIPIFLSADNNYAPFVATTIASISDNTESYCDFYILDSGITDENKEKICDLKNQFTNFSIEFLEVDLEKYFKDFPESQYISKAMYSRFLIPDLVPKIDKAIYSDVDVIILDNIEKMYNEDLEGYALGAVWEEYAELNVNQKRKRSLNLSYTHKYFSSGNLLIDCNQWRKDKITSKLLRIVKEKKDILFHGDMDVLNICFDNNYKMLSPKYCWINQNFYFYDDHDKIVIRHFNGAIKPWQINPNISTSVMPAKDIFWNYAKQTIFYEELYKKTLDEKEQQLLLRHLKLNEIFIKKIIKKI